MGRANGGEVAILGGGAGSLTAAFELTATPELRERYDVTVYQLGWRLGGKGASGRREIAGGPAHRGARPPRLVRLLRERVRRHPSRLRGARPARRRPAAHLARRLPPDQRGRPLRRHRGRPLDPAALPLPRQRRRPRDRERAAGAAPADARRDPHAAARRAARARLAGPQGAGQVLGRLPDRPGEAARRRRRRVRSRGPLRGLPALRAVPCCTSTGTQHATASR